MLLKALFQEALEKLKIDLGAGEAKARLNILLEDYFHLKRKHLLTHPDFQFSPDKEREWREAVQRLMNGEPVQYICGSAQFYGLEFRVDRSVLIPRSETEELVDFAAKKLAPHFSGNILDVGTGSGCIAISVAKACPKAKVLAIDYSDAALSVAKENARNNQADISFFQMDFLDESKWEVLPEIDVLLSNPPYVSFAEWEELEAVVKAHEPALALHPPKGENALVFYEKLEKFARKKLKPNGFLLFEINEQFGHETLDIFQSDSFKNQKLLKDLNGKNRFVFAERGIG